MLEVKIKNIKRIEKRNRYDLTVNETSNFFANGILIHNSSVRLANVLVRKQLKWYEKLAKRFGFHIVEHVYKPVAASRRVIKYRDAGDHYYNTDIYNESLSHIAHLIPKNMVIYGELVGWANDKPIQKHYTYKIQQGKHELYVYRISFVNNDGYRLDLTWYQVKEWCVKNNVKHVPEVWKGHFKNFNVDEFMNKKFVKDLHLTQCLQLDDKAPCDEGVVIMKYGLQGYFTKAKSPDFLRVESSQLDTGEVDTESVESEHGE